MRTTQQINKMEVERRNGSAEDAVIECASEESCRPQDDHCAGRSKTIASSEVKIGLEFARNARRSFLSYGTRRAINRKAKSCLLRTGCLTTTVASIPCSFESRADPQVNAVPAIS